MGLPFVGYAESTGLLRGIYDRILARPAPPVYRPRHGGVAGIIQAHSMDPALITKVFGASPNGSGPLPWHERELVNAVTSRLNQCFY